ncbi:PREDICTED: uncharacterized protein LOC108355600 [Rhagoletis zephyria]|uniref:uncharacterized protein LOC108355600 n=1 Tax=Rhagoletis zephyria TaxID=28612 RepID=UPI000811551C|nr:PREDICTED: uncharacterized protein LOC108355600 [Rhagoletis zephyria]
MNNSSQDHIILATAIVLVRDASGGYRLGRTLLDSCSQVNFITDELSQTLMLPRRKHNTEIKGIGKSSTNIKYTTSTNIKSQVTEFELPLTFCITSHIAYQPEPEKDTSSWDIPSSIVLADNQFYKSKKIDLPLGTESFFSLLSVGQIKLGDSLPILQKTLLGWDVSGRYRASSNTLNTKCLHACEESIDSRLEKLWQIEEVTSKADVWTREQHSWEKLYNDTVTRSPNGPIVVKLPFKDDPACLGESYTTALRRFSAQKRRLLRSPNLRTQYIEFMDEYERLGHMQVVLSPNLNQPHYYIPHHRVLKPGSTKKLRVVFDASCQTTTQTSLNDIQMTSLKCIGRCWSVKNIEGSSTSCGGVRLTRKFKPSSLIRSHTEWRPHHTSRYVVCITLLINMHRNSSLVQMSSSHLSTLMACCAVLTRLRNFRE